MEQKQVSRAEQLPPGVYRRPGSSHLWIRYHHRGQLHRESAHTSNPRAAARLRGRRLAELDAGTFIGPRQERVTVAQLLGGYVENRRLAGKVGLRNIEQRCGRMKKSLGGVRAVDVTLPRLERWANEQLAAGFARGTVKVDLAYVRAAFNVARRQGLITLRPEFPTIRVDNARQGFFEPHQYVAVRDAIAGYGPHGAMLADVVAFYYLSGWRGSEVLTLPWAYVDRQERLIVLPSTGTTKRAKDRTLPLDFRLESGEWANGELWQLIERRWKARIVGARLVPLVFHRAGKPVVDFKRLWRRACAAAGVEGRIPHDFRRTRVRDLVNAGVPDKVAMSWTGHTTREVFDRYHIVTAEDQRRAMAAAARRTATVTILAPAQNRAQSGGGASASGR